MENRRRLETSRRTRGAVEAAGKTAGRLVVRVPRDDAIVLAGRKRTYLGEEAEVVAEEEEEEEVH